MSRLLITGASGFLGQAILHRFPNWEIHAVRRAENNVPSSAQVHWHSLDLLDNDAVTDLLQELQADHLLHLAWETSPNHYWTSRKNFSWVSASLHLLDVFEAAGGKRAVIAGTCAEYQWNMENCQEYKTPLSYSSPYAAAKTSFSHLAQSFAAQTGLSLAWGRIFFPYGFHEAQARLIPSLIRHLLQGQVFELQQGENIRDFIHVKDAASIFAQLLQSDYQGFINVGSGHAVALKNLAYLIAEKLNAQDLLVVKHLPETINRVVADTQLLEQQLHWKPEYSLEQGIELTIQWWQSRLEKLNE